MSDLIIRDFNGHQIPQRADGYLNATAMCKANGKSGRIIDRMPRRRNSWRLCPGPLEFQGTFWR